MRMFHGTARVREEKTKFQVNKSFKETIFHYTTSLPLSRHNDHHSGETIDQFSRANDALRDFSGSNFMYITTVMRFVTSIAMLVRIWPL
jgi:ATP-binding cassette subfamily B protein